MLPEFLRPSGPVLATALILWLLLDYAYPEHRGLLLKIHPVHTCFNMAKRLGKPYSSRTRGVLVWFLCVSLHMAPYAALLYLAWRFSVALWIPLCCYVLKVSMSLRLLTKIVEDVERAAREGDWSKARGMTQLIVRRNVYILDEPHVLSAAIESLAENFVDGFVSPLFYYILLGPLGALLQRLANTMDGALGYVTPELRDVGWFSAMIDTVMNYIPARLGALTIALVGGLRYRRLREAVRVWKSFCSSTPSRNAGHPMSAIAGVLGVTLEKPSCYTLGVGPYPTPKHVYQALEVVKIASAVWIALSVSIMLAAPIGREILP